MSTLSIKAAKNTISSKNILIHSLFFILGLGYAFYFFPEWSVNRFHIYAPFILAGIDVLAFYLFFGTLSLLRSRKLVAVPLLFLIAIVFLYYSSTFNYARFFDDVITVDEVSLVFSKIWVLATIPRLLLVIGASLLYYFLIDKKEKSKKLINTKKINKFINLEFALITFIAFTLLTFKQPPISDRDFTEVLVLKTVLYSLFVITALGLSHLLFKLKKHMKFLGLLLLCYIVSISIIMPFLYFKGTLDAQSALSSKFWLPFSSIFLLVTASGLLYGGVRHLIINRFKKTEKALGDTTSELLLLKSQVNPHFLFNTLNTLYATALEEDATITASATAKLANLVRYMQQDMQQAFIPLKREAGYISDYLNIQKLRIASPLEIKTAFIDLDEVQISPGLLIPFVENAFKYGVDPDETSSIEISIKVEKQQIHFCCKNTYNPEQTTYYREKGFGIGIQNTRERLELIYPSRYDLKIDKNQNRFEVKLKINTL